MINVIVCGAAGRMGQRIIQLIKEENDLKLVGAIEASGYRGIGMPVTSEVKITDDLSKLADRAEVIVDFTSPKATLSNLEIIAKLKKAVVIGTTGFTDEEIKNIESIARNLPCLLSANMSIGINLLLKIVREVAGVLGDSYDIEIVEAHHNRKKDAPSGTALALAKEITESLERNMKEDIIYGRKGLVGERSPKEIGIHAIRGGDIVGEHTVIFAGQGERVELIHRATSRDTFVRGVIRAIRFVAQAPVGFYNMQDVLGLK